MINFFFGHKTKVLVVNGSRREAGIMSGYLPDSEFKVIKAESGKGGLKAALKELPEIIILDSDPAAGNGWETLAQLKNDNKTASIPVLMCTPMGDAAMSEKAYSCGAQGCIPKPLKKEMVVSRIARRLNRPGEPERGSSRKSFF